MLLELTPLEVSILLSAELMYSMVPFTHVTKQPRAKADMTCLEKLCDEIRQKRDVEWTPAEINSRDSDLILECELEESEMALFVTILRVCLEECKNDPVHRELHLRARNEEDVLRVIEKLELRA